MLSLRLKSGEYLTIGDNIAVQVFRQKGDSVEVAVKAPREIPVLRGELLERTNERPEGLRKGDYKRPSQFAHNAKRLEILECKRENRAAAVESMAALLSEIEAGEPQLHDKIQAIRMQLAKLA